MMRLLLDPVLELLLESPLELTPELKIKSRFEILANHRFQLKPQGGLHQGSELFSELLNNVQEHFIKPWITFRSFGTSHEIGWAKGLCGCLLARESARLETALVETLVPEMKEGRTYLRPTSGTYEGPQRNAFSAPRLGRT